MKKVIRSSAAGSCCGNGVRVDIIGSDCEFLPPYKTKKWLYLYNLKLNSPGKPFQGLDRCIFCHVRPDDISAFASSPLQMRFLRV